MKRMEDGGGEHLSLLSLFFLSPEGSNLWVTETYCPSPCPCCHDLCDVVRDVGCCTSLCTPFPIVDTFLSPSDHGLQDLVPWVHMVEAPEEGCGSGSHRGSESGWMTGNWEKKEWRRKSGNQERKKSAKLINWLNGLDVVLWIQRQEQSNFQNDLITLNAS